MKNLVAGSSRIALLALLFISATVAAASEGLRFKAEGAEARVADDFVVGQHACLTLQVGRAFLEGNLNRAIEDIVSHLPGKASAEWRGKAHPELSPLVTGPEHLRAWASIKKEVAFMKKEINGTTPIASARGSVTLGVKLGSHAVEREPWMTGDGDLVEYPHLELVSEAACASGSCEEFERLTRAALDWETGQFWDLPTSVQTLKGLLRSLKEASSGQPQAMITLTAMGGVSATINCKGDLISTLPEASSSSFEIGFSQNPIELLYPRHLDLSLQKLPALLKEFNVQMPALLSGFSGDLDIVSDPSLLMKADRSLKAPSLHVSPVSKKDRFGVTTLNRVEVDQTLLVSVTEVGNAVSLIPVEISLGFNLGLVDSIKTYHGTSQQIYLDPEEMDLSVHVRECSHVPSGGAEPESAADEKASGDSDEEDFEDDEDEKPASKASQPSHLANLACSLRSRANDIVQDYFKEVKSGSASTSSSTDWLSFSEIVHSFKFLCSGVQIRQPRMRLEQSRFVLEFPLADPASALRIDGLCSNATQVKVYEDPASMEKAKSMEYFDVLLQNTMTFSPGFYLPMYFRGQKWPLEKMPSVALDFLTRFPALVDYCKNTKGHLVKGNEVKALQCASHYFFFKNDRITYDEVLGPITFVKASNRYFETYYKSDIPVFGNYISEAQQFAKRAMLFEVQRSLLNFGLLLYLIGIKIRFKYMALIIVAVLFGAHMASLLQPFNRYGPEYYDNLKLAGKFAIGETSYSKLGQHPAGNIWYYLPHYYLHLNFEWAEFLVKLWHFTLHASSIIMLTKLAYQAFVWEDGGSLKGQLAGFISMSNFGTVFQSQELYTENVTRAALVAALYFMANGRPRLSSLFFTMGLSIQSRAWFMLPGLLGWTQYQHGPLVFAQVCSIIIGFQALIATPFSFTADGSLNYDYLRTLNPFPPEQPSHTLTYFWSFLSKDIYSSPEFTNTLQWAILAVNVYYFFIRRGFLVRFFTSLRPKRITVFSRRYAVEIISVMFVASCSLIPGGKNNAQGLYMELLPILLLMTHLPMALFFQVYQVTWPGRKLDRPMHHLVMLALIVYLLTIGAKRLAVPTFKLKKVKKD